MANEIRTFYFGENVAIDNETLIEYNEMLSDIWMVYDMDRVTKLHAKKSNGKTYYYRLVYTDTIIPYNLQKMHSFTSHLNCNLFIWNLYIYFVCKHFGTLYIH